jgi:hypothetical protein
MRDTNIITLQKPWIYVSDTTIFWTIFCYRIFRGVLKKRESQFSCIEV